MVAADRKWSAANERRVSTTCRAPIVTRSRHRGHRTPWRKHRDGRVPPPALLLILANSGRRAGGAGCWPVPRRGRSARPRSARRKRSRRPRIIPALPKSRRSGDRDDVEKYPIADVTGIPRLSVAAQG